MKYKIEVHEVQKHKSTSWEKLIENNATQATYFHKTNVGILMVGTGHEL